MRSIREHAQPLFETCLRYARLLSMSVRTKLAGRTQSCRSPYEPAHDDAPVDEVSGQA
jgi:hypothetical protein